MDDIPDRWQDVTVTKEDIEKYGWETVQFCVSGDIFSGQKMVIDHFFQRAQTKIDELIDTIMESPHWRGQKPRNVLVREEDPEYSSFRVEGEIRATYENTQKKKLKSLRREASKEKKKKKKEEEEYEQYLKLAEKFAGDTPNS
jgi:hypothetical protein